MFIDPIQRVIDWQLRCRWFDGILEMVKPIKPIRAKKRKIIPVAFITGLTIPDFKGRLQTRDLYYDYFKQGKKITQYFYDSNNTDENERNISLSTPKNNEAYNNKCELEQMILGAIDAKDKLMSGRDLRIRYLLEHGYTQEIVGQMEELSQQHISRIKKRCKKTP